MATMLQVEILVPATEPVDPYRYGWRYVRRVDENGAETWDQVPLTLLDVLHPEEDDFIVQNAAHARRCRYLADVLTTQLAAEPSTVVLHDVRVDWGVPDIRPHGPDIVVLAGVREQRDWATVRIKAEGAEPVLVIEVTSPSTATLDRDTKLNQYEQIGVPVYVIVDTVVGDVETRPRLTGYQLVAGRFQPLPPDEHGRLWLAVARVWLAVADGEIVCFDEVGERLGDYAAERNARQVAEQQRDAATARVRELEAELRRLRGT
ncbi:MAG: Uma2 family endonuclease [Chloroflexi bacterium]|nr:Uma2 family endonuclease [Chloroflexota bacterium]